MKSALLMLAAKPEDAGDVQAIFRGRTEQKTFLCSTPRASTAEQS